MAGLVDYLENHLANRLEQTELDMKLVNPDTKESNENPSLETSAVQDTFAAFSGTEMEELELLLQEFLL